MEKNSFEKKKKKSPWCWSDRGDQCCFPPYLNSSEPTSSCFSLPHANKLICSVFPEEGRMIVSFQTPSRLAFVRLPSISKNSHQRLCCERTESGAFSNSMMVHRSSRSFCTSMDNNKWIRLLTDEKLGQAESYPYNLWCVFFFFFFEIWFYYLNIHKKLQSKKS